MLVRSLGLAAMCAVLLVLPALAHHSHGNYDVTKWTTMEVTDAKGEPTVWAMEATGPGGLQRVGVKKEDLKAGDSVKVRCHLLRDGSNGCLLGFVTPTHGDLARGHGVERDWDGGGGAGTPVPAGAPTPR